jgi:hypothetical protein
MENLFRNHLVSKNQYPRSEVFASSFPRNAHMSKYNPLINPILYSDWQATYKRIVRINHQTSHNERLKTWRLGFTRKDLCFYHHFWKSLS